MSESDWATFTDPQAMLAFLQGRGPVSDRKLRLFAAGCCWQMAGLLPDQHPARSRLDVAERYADGLADDQELRSSHVFALCGGGLPLEDIGGEACHEQALAAALYASAMCQMLAHQGNGLSAPAPRGLRGRFTRFWARAAPPALPTVDEVKRTQSDLLRDLFGNPFHPFTFAPEWRTEVVVALSRSTYEERAWDRMGVLGDALEEAGADPELVRHCREPGVHVKGCHVLDAALDRS